MADFGVMEIAGAASLAASGLSAGGSIMGGNSRAAAARLQGQGQYEADMFRADQADQAAGYGRVKAAQTNTYMLDKLQRSLSTIKAITAASGADPNSPSNFAVLNATQGQGDRARAISVGNIYAQADSDQASAAWYRRAGQMALMGAGSAASGAELSGWLGAGGSILRGASGLNFGGRGNPDAGIDYDEAVRQWNE